MGYLKMNKLHLTITNDEAWRMELLGYPELTKIGSQRGFDITETKCLITQLGSGIVGKCQYYSQQELVDLIALADSFFVEVIIEIDLPAHARAAVMSLRDTDRYLHDPEDRSRVVTQQYYNNRSFVNPANKNVYRLIETIIEQLK